MEHAKPVVEDQKKQSSKNLESKIKLSRPPINVVQKTNASNRTLRDDEKYSNISEKGNLEEEIDRIVGPEQKDVIASMKLEIYRADQLKASE